MAKSSPLKSKFPNSRRRNIDAFETTAVKKNPNIELTPGHPVHASCCGLGKDTVDASLFISVRKKGSGDKANDENRVYEVEDPLKSELPPGDEVLETVTCFSRNDKKVEKTKVKQIKFTWRELFWNLLSIGCYLFDVGFDLFVVYWYYTGEEWCWFGLTLAFVVVPSLTMTMFSLSWYFQDPDRELKKNIERHPFSWFMRILFHVLQLGPVVRYVDTIIYGLKMKKEKNQKTIEKYYILKIWEDVDASMLRLLECYLEAAPQLTLQLYILIINLEKSNFLITLVKFGSCSTSLVSISWALTSYHSALRSSLDNKSELNCVGSIFMFLWRALVIAARVLSFAIFASIFGFWVFAVVGVHWVFMLGWILKMDTNFCKNNCFLEMFFKTMAAVVNVFDYFNLVEGNTRMRYLIFYSLVCLETLTMGALCFFFHRSEIKQLPYLVPSAVAIVIMFILGFVFQAVYYHFFHPTKQQKSDESAPAGNGHDVVQIEAPVVEGSNDVVQEDAQFIKNDGNVLQKGVPSAEIGNNVVQRETQTAGNGIDMV